MDKDSDLLKGLFIGGLIGIALGLLFAPKSGKETREDITRRANKMLAKAKEEYEKTEPITNFSAIELVAKYMYQVLGYKGERLRTSLSILQVKSQFI